VAERWSLSIGTPFEGPEVSAAWVAPVHRADGATAILKLGMPHMEARDEIAGLRFWDGDPKVRRLEADEELDAMLLERCEPGTHLRTLPEPEQDVVIAQLLRRLWRLPAAPHPFPSPLRLWLFARSAADPRDNWRDAELELARRLAPA